MARPEASEATAAAAASNSDPPCFYEEIERSRPHEMQWRQWQHEERGYRWLVEMQEETHRTRQNELYQLLGMFAVMQSLIFSAVAQAGSSRLHSCGDAGTPILLSAVTFLATTAAVSHKLASIGELLHSIRTHKNFADRIYGVMEVMKMRGLSFDLDQDVHIHRWPPAAARSHHHHHRSEKGAANTSNRLVLGPRSRHVFSPWGLTLLSFVALLSFAVIVSCASILCQQPLQLVSCSSCSAAPPAAAAHP